jgi:zinc/manganese transport system ATP-binding protein
MSADLQLSNLTVTYDRHPAVHHVSGCFAAGSLTAIVGPNGAGKSTLLKAVAGFLRPAEGWVDLGGLPRQSLGYLPQAAELDRSFPVTVFDTVAMGAWRRIGSQGRLSAGLAALAMACLDAVGLAGFEARAVGSLSSGQLQRVLFARLLLQDAPVIILDEPFTAVDARTTADLLRLVHDWHGQGRTVIAVLHDLEQVREHFPTTLLLARTTIAWGATQDVLTDANLRRAQVMAEHWNPDAMPCSAKVSSSVAP